MTEITEKQQDMLGQDRLKRLQYERMFLCSLTLKLIDGHSTN
jgi:hypothetical protein